IKIDGKEIDLKKEHIIVSKEIPTPYEEADFKYGSVYVNKERSEKLEAEGYAREITRRIQSMRKELGMKKSQQVSVFVKTDEGSASMLEEWDEQIKSKVGAEKLKISVNKPSRRHQKNIKEKIKDREFEIYLSEAGGK
ncbi:MAG: DUF5915 domain-containing protein, partial [Nanoarchaeota archaeon]|nr:DUF5915 domain-containing protein [Nanoarchaeota archaeon]